MSHMETSVIEYRQRCDSMLDTVDSTLREAENVVEVIMHGSTKLLDRKGEEFPIVKDCGTCRSVVLNGKKLYWLDRQSDWRNLGLYALRLLFTTENPREVDQVLRAWQSAAPFDPGGATRGLYLRGVE